MFTPGRYIVIDDNRDELRKLIDALHELGAPCVGIHYDPAKGVAPSLLAGVRVLFLDLHLIGGVQVGQQKKAYDVILEMLDTGIGAAGGPYVIVLWTMHAHQRDEFEAYLAERLPPAKRPLAVLKLDKRDYLAADVGANATKLRADVTSAISADPRLHALLSWERDVLAAAGATLSELGTLIPPASRTPAEYGDRLDGILSVLAKSAAGEDHAARDIRCAVSAALAPILSDRILNQRPDPESDEVWKKAVTKIGDDSCLDTREAARINTMLHAALAPAENISPHDWGAIVLLPDSELNDDAMRRRFALTKGELMFSASPARTKSGRNHCRLALIRTGASCDYAQNRKGPIPYVLSIIVPAEVELKDTNKISKGQLETPVLDLPELGLIRVFIDARYQISLVKGDVEAWQTVCRIREQLLMQIAAHCAEYSTRPGIISIQPGASPQLEAPSSPAPETMGAKDDES